MEIIVVASQKGGSGKTTTTRSLAVLAQKTLGPTVIIDLDPQGSLTAWWNRREDQQPALVAFDISEFAERMAQLEAAGIEYVFVDTPPSVHPEILDVMRKATMIVVPVRPSPDDLDAVRDTLSMIEAAGAPFVFVLTQAKHRTRLQLSAVQALAQHGKLAPTVIHDRTDFPTTAISGQTVNEQEAASPSGREVQDVLEYVVTQCRKYGSATATA